MTDEAKDEKPALQMSFQVWWGRFLHCAEEACFDVNPDEAHLYREYYDDGDTPEEAIDNELEAFEAANGDYAE